MEPVLRVLGLATLALLVPAGMFLVTRPDTVLDRLGALAHRLRRRPDPVEQVRPIEVVAAEVRRRGRQFHARHVSHVKAEAARSAYDAVLVEACRELGVDCLLGVLEPGPELDAERLRVERVLHRWGLDLGGLGEAA